MLIHINKLTVFARHGVMDQERIVGANFHVSLDAEVEVTEEALRDDNLEGTVSYADIIDVIKAEMQTPSKLLEHLCYRIGNKLLITFPLIQSLTLRIDKENPPCGVKVDGIGVSIHLSKNTFARQ